MDKRKEAFEKRGYVITQFPTFDGYHFSIEEVWNAAWDAATALEREECAKVCEEEGAYSSQIEMAHRCAEAIRDRFVTIDQ